jgi:CheY-like chemotaxis protein
MSELPKVLIVDYEPRALKSLSDLLGKSGYIVEIAKDGITALSAYKEGRPDIVLLEAMIPKKHGFEVCQEIKKSPHGKDTPVIIMTAVYKGRKHRTQAMHVHGCDEYVEKPCTPESILEIVKRFVPPGDVALALAVGENSSSGARASEKLGEVIPFPADRTSYTLTDVDDDTEREIMSKLDEILPDTPLFDVRGAAADTEVASTEAAIVDFEMDALLGKESETASHRSAVEPGGSGSPSGTASSATTDAPAIDPAKRAVQSKRVATAMKADEVEKLTRQRKRRPEVVEKKPFLSKTSIVILVLASIITAIVYLAGKV